jgi:hypothetical protein
VPDKVGVTDRLRTCDKANLGKARSIKVGGYCTHACHSLGLSGAFRSGPQPHFTPPEGSSVAVIHACPAQREFAAIKVAMEALDSLRLPANSAY